MTTYLQNTIFADEPPVISFHCTDQFIRDRPIVNIMSQSKRFSRTLRSFKSIDNDQNVRSESKFLLMTTTVTASYQKQIEQLGFGQYFNRIQGNDFVSKQNLASAVRQQQHFFKDTNTYYNIHPKTFLIPQEKKELLKQFQNQYYIQKPDCGSKGQGITIANNLLDFDLTQESVIQEYESTMLLNGHKFDVRIHILITSIDPFICYIYKEGFVRIAKQLYAQPTALNQNFTQTHLTNIAVNNPESNDSFMNDSGDPCLIRLTDFFLIYPHLKKSVEDLVNQTMVTIHPNILKQAQLCSTRLHEYPKTTFQVFGLDVYFTPNGEAKLFEINRNPVLKSISNIHKEIQGQEILSDSLELLGLRINLDKNNKIIHPKGCKDDPRIYRWKGEVEYSHTIQQLKTNDFNINLLTEFEKRAVLQIKDEATRLGGYQRIKFENMLEQFREPSYMTYLMYTCIQ
ncbi:Tubulin_tyrosine ligase [Hexamita inflata]|uniref:Tubulin tyrosine ligase n=1 Tax=Hexamita inflata TaxID=28002 RepID=A0AA86VTD5_9EUKA|nr:Tubulin tyrosine ligase [Hexamita inflata]